MSCFDFSCKVGKGSERCESSMKSSRNTRQGCAQLNVIEKKKSEKKCKPHKVSESFLSPVCANLGPL